MFRYWVGIICLLIIISSLVVARSAQDDEKNSCINNLRRIEAAKDAYAMEHSLPEGWTWSNDVIAFREFYREDGRISAYIKEYPHCPASTNTVRSADQAASEYAVNPIGSNAACKVKYDHRLQAVYIEEDE